MHFRKLLRGKLLKPHSYYMKVLLNYFAFTFLLLLVTFFTSIRFFLPAFERKIEESNLNLLRHVQSSTDEKISSSTAEIISNHFVETGSSPLPRFFSPAYPLSTNTIIDSYQTLATITQTHEYIHSIYLYRYFDDTLLSVPQGITYGALSGGRNFPADISGLIDKIAGENIQPVWLSPETTSAFFDSKSIITYGTNIPLRFSGGKNDGIVIINLDQEKLLESVQNMYSEDSFLLMLSKDGRVYSHTGENSQIDLAGVSSQILPGISDSDEGVLTIKLHNETFGMVWLKSPEWAYVYLIPLSQMTDQAADMLRTVVFVFIGVFLLAVVLLNLITFRLHKPLRQLVTTLSSNPDVKKCEDGDDFAYMENVFSYLSHRVGEMEKTMDSNRSTIEDKAFIDLLYAAPQNNPKNSLGFFLADAPSQNFQLLILEVDSCVLANLENTQQQFIIIKAREYTESFLRAYGKSFCICHPANAVVSLLSFEKFAVNPADGLKLLDLLLQKMGVNFNVFISESTGSLSEISTAYDGGKCALDYRFIYNYHNVFTPQDIISAESFSFDSNQDFFEQLRSLILSNQPQQIEGLLGEKTAAIRRERHSCAYVQRFCQQLSQVTASGCKQLGVQISREENQELTSRFNKVTSLDSSIAWAFAAIKLHLGKIEHRNAAIHSDFIHQAAEYISTHIEEDITLKSVAHEFHISSSHLSRLFKDCLNTSFQDYVFDKKLERAAWYLENDPAKNVRTISGLLGYMTPAYFAKIFKGRYGVTPSQYRKQQRISADSSGESSLVKDTDNT